MKWGPGKLLYIHIASASAETMQELSVAELIKNNGIRGDRYFKGNGKYLNIPDIREITIIEKEVLDALKQNQLPPQKNSIILIPHDHRRNLTSEDVSFKISCWKKNSKLVKLF